MGNLQPSPLITPYSNGVNGCSSQAKCQWASFPYCESRRDRGIRYGRPPRETLGIKRKGIDGRAHKEWNLRLSKIGRVLRG